MIKFRARHNTGQFRSYLAQLAAATRSTIPDTVRGEAAAVMRAVMQREKPRLSRKALEDKGWWREMGRVDNGQVQVSVSLGYRKLRHPRGTMWLREAGSTKVRRIGLWMHTLKGPLASSTGLRDRVPNELWAKAVAAWASNLPVAQQRAARTWGARGLTARSWLELAELILGQEVAAPAYVRSAKPISRPPQRIATKAEFGLNSARYVLHTTNRSGIAVKTGGRAKLNAAIAARRRLFENALKKGFFEDAKFVAKNYRWVSIRA